MAAALVWTVALLGPATDGECEAAGGILAGNDLWSGLVRIEEDVLIPPGVTLTISPGARVVFAAAPGTKTEPWFWTPGTELTVGGRLIVQGTEDSPVVFEGEGPWGGVVVAPEAEAQLTGLRVIGPAEGLLCAGSCEVADVRIERAENGVVLAPGGQLRAARAIVADCRIGLLDLRGSGPPVSGLEVRTSADAERLALPTPPRAVASVEFGAVNRPRTEYVGGYSVEADETWRGEVVIAGRVTVAPGAVLTLEPGTRVLLRKLDTNGDGLGEGEILVLGGIRSLGAPGRPVVFDSAEPQPQPGDWDKVSLISSEVPNNLFRQTVFRNGTQALHSHFSRFSAEECLFEKNLRAVQFQESESVVLERCVFLNNKQALRFRDSRVRAAGNVFLGNLFGVHVFRGDLEFTGNTLEGSALGCFLAKESRVVFEGNRLAANRDGVRMRDPGSWALIRGNRFGPSAEDALSLSYVGGRVEDNVFDDAGLDLASVENSDIVFRGNTFGGCGRDALHLKGTKELDASRNFWGTEDPGKRIQDKEDNPRLGAATWYPPLSSPADLPVPRAEW